MKKKKPENEITNYSNNDVITTMIVIVLAAKNGKQRNLVSISNRNGRNF